MKRPVFLTLLCCLLIIAIVSSVQAQGDPLVITPYRGPAEYHVAEGREVIIRAGWGACTRGLAEASRHASTVSMDIQYGGSPWLAVEPPSHDYWNPPQSSPAADPNACVMQTDLSWWTEWLYSLGALEAGTYDVHFVWTFLHPLPDGGDYDGDGKIDIFSSENFYNESDITIHVE